MDTQKLRRHAGGLLLGYVLQFLVGMSLNLFIALPTNHPGTSGSEYFTRSGHSLLWALSGHGSGVLAVHVYIGLFLVLGSVALFVHAFLAHSRRWKVCGGLAAFFTVGAFFNGLSFVDFNKNVSSMIMATCWLVAVAVLVIGLTAKSLKVAPPSRHR